MAEDQTKPEVAQAPVEKSEVEKAADDKNARFNAFLKAYGELVQQHQVDIASYPVFTPDGQGGFRVVVQNTTVDITNQPKKSPFVAQ